MSRGFGAKMAFFAGFLGLLGSPRRRFAGAGTHALTRRHPRARRSSVVVFQTEVGYEFLSPQVTQRVLELHQLDE